ncbi:MAG: hypothetical protein EBZ05_09555, partial [Verrucomicrobia bacterium]|nr:hypothetical protein [Verrucomicrobiota bacterium]
MNPNFVWGGLGVGWENVKLALIVGMGAGLALPLVAKENQPESWTKFISAQDRSLPEILTDYSFAGYEHGEKAIPDVTGPIFKVTDYGALPD